MSQMNRRRRPRREAWAEFQAVAQELGEALAQVPPEKMAEVEARESEKTRRGAQHLVAKLKQRGQ